MIVAIIDVPTALGNPGNKIYESKKNYCIKLFTHYIFMFSIKVYMQDKVTSFLEEATGIICHTRATA